MVAPHEELAKQLEHAEPRQGGVYRSECPFCREHGFWLTSRGFNCHSCDVKGSLEQLSQHLDDGHTGEALPRPVRALGAIPPPMPEFLVESLLLRQEVNLVVADGGAWKTTTWLSVAAAIAGGYRVADHFQVTQAGPVLWISEEDSLGVLLNRLDALCAGHGWDTDQVKGNTHVLALQSCSLDDHGWREHLINVIQELGAVLVVFDPYRDLTAAKENSSDENRANTHFFRELCKLGATVLVIHHLGKQTEGKRKLDRVRGSSALAHAMRVIWMQTEVQGGVSLECLKMSRAERPAAFVLEIDIEADEKERTVWKAARFTFQAHAENRRTTAEAFVLEQLTDQPGPNSTAIRKATQRRNQAQSDLPSISAQDVSDAIAALSARGEIDHEKRAHGSKNWFRVTSPADLGNLNSNLAEVAHTLPGKVEDASDDLAQPSYREGKVGRAAELVGQADGDSKHPADEELLEVVHDCN